MLANWYDLTRLATESQYVIWKRLMRIAAGGAIGRREMARLIPEKVAAATQAGAIVLSGGSPKNVVKSYRKKVHANARRLSKR